MTKRISMLLAASVFLTGATGIFLGSMTSAHAITSVDELSDVDANHWAYEALRDLVEKYDVIEGYPDGTFRGGRTPTRWELAAALNALLKAVGRDLARLGAEKANKTDLQALARLQEEFRNELTALQARTSALEARASAIEAKNEEQDNRLSLLEKTQIHGDLSVGFLSDISSGGTRGASGASHDDGILDGISTIGRLRLTLDVPVKEDNEDSYFGRGDIHTRLIAAFGRTAPAGANQGNGGAFGVFNGYSRIATDASGGNEGLLNGNLVGGGNNRSNLYVENMHYKQHVKSGLPLLSDWFPGMDVLPDSGWETTGDLYVGVVPWRYLFDKSPYRGNELSQFQNTAFINAPGVQTNYNMPMVAYQWHQGLGSDDLNFDLTTAVGTIDNGDAMNGFNLSYEGRLNYNSSFLGLGDMPGSLYAGGYHFWLNGNSNSTNSLLNGTTNRNAGGSNAAHTFARHNSSGTASSFYVGWNQEWYDGIGTTVNYMLGSNNRANYLFTSANNSIGGVNAARANEAIAVAVKQGLGAVLNVPMKALVPGWRDNDVWGIGYAMVELQEDNIGLGNHAAIDDAWEKVLETYYRWQVNDAVSVVPSVQFIWNRLGVEQNGFTTVLGLRTNFTF